MSSISTLTESTMPSRQEIALAEESKQLLADFIGKNKSSVFRLVHEDEALNVVLPKRALKLLIVILSQMAKGNAVTLLPVQAELTSQEAADLLNVSRPFLISLLTEGKIPFRKVGSRHRVLAKDILNYKDNINQQRLKTLSELAERDQELDME